VARRALKDRALPQWLKSREAQEVALPGCRRRLVGVGHQVAEAAHGFAGLVLAREYAQRLQACHRQQHRDGQAASRSLGFGRRPGALSGVTAELAARSMLRERTLLIRYHRR
jgi:hypothetical protein